MRVGIMTGGGDSSGINAAIWSVVRRAHHYGWEVVGLRRGWAGLLEKDTVPLTMEAVAAIPYTGGTFIHTSRTNVFKIDNGPQHALDSIKALGLDALIAMGGDDTLGVAHRLCELGLPAVGLPQTIDNDIGETDFSIGYDTAVNICTEAIQRMHSTNYSHQADMLVEAKDTILTSAAAMREMLADVEANTASEERFPCCENERVCRRCNFRQACPYIGGDGRL